MPIIGWMQAPARPVLEIPSWPRESIREPVDLDQLLTDCEKDRHSHEAQQHSIPRKAGLAYRYEAKGTPKDVVSRRWLSLHEDGKVSSVAARYTVARKLGLQPRDIRLLELPAGSRPPALLSRESAIVVCFESIRCILSVDRVIVTNPDDDKGRRLLEDLVAKLATSQAASATKKVGGAAVFPGMSRISSVARKIQYGRGSKNVELPFELKALEICFDHLVRAIDKDLKRIEMEALPVLHNLTVHIHWPDLDIIRKVKHKLASMKTRILSIHGVLDRFLAHDEDMHRLNLTAEELSRKDSEEAHVLERLSRVRMGQRVQRGGQGPSAGGGGGACSSLGRIHSGKPLGKSFVAHRREGSDVSEDHSVIDNQLFVDTSPGNIRPPLTATPRSSRQEASGSNGHNRSPSSIASSLNESDGVAPSWKKTNSISDESDGMAADERDVGDPPDRESTTGRSASTFDRQD